MGVEQFDAAKAAARCGAAHWPFDRRWSRRRFCAQVLAGAAVLGSQRRLTGQDAPAVTEAQAERDPLQPPGQRRNGPASGQLEYPLWDGQGRRE